jgi:hypothetical protein
MATHRCNARQQVPEIHPVSGILPDQKKYHHIYKVSRIKHSVDDKAGSPCEIGALAVIKE